MAVVTGLFVYPVKSMRRLAVDEAQVRKRGLEGDRRWLVVDSDGRFISQREVAAMATFSVQPVGTGLQFSCPGFGDALVSQPQGPSRQVVVWNDTVEAVDAGDGISEWLSAALDREARLVYMPDESVRPTHPDFSVPGDIVSFADGFPCMLTNEASLVGLNSRIGSPVPMERFRPNIVVSGFAAWEEDGWTVMTINDLSFRCVKNCGRCIVTTTDQDTGERSGPEPLQTLTQFRLIGQAAVFGKNVTPDGEGLVRVGDSVTVS